MTIGVRIKRALAGLAALFIITSVFMAPLAKAQTFKDVPPDRWSYEFVEQLVADGVLTVADYYRPTESLNRAELVKMAVEATGVGIIDNLPATPTFEDVPRDAWFGPYVETAVKLGWVEGYRDASGNLTGMFGPGDSVNRAAATKIMVNSFGVPSAPDCAENPFSDVKAADWFSEFVLTAYWNRIVSGYRDAAGNLTGKFGPADIITREQAAKVVVNAANPDPMECPAPECEEDADCAEGEMCEDGSCVDVIEPECEEDADCAEGEMCSEGFCRLESEEGVGTLEISLNEEEAGADRDIPFNATRLTYLPLMLTANAPTASLVSQAEGGVTIYSLTVTRQGLGDDDDFDELWVEDQDGNIVSITVSINNEDQAKIRFPGGLFVPYGETVKIFIVASMDDNSLAGNTNKIVLLSADAGDSTAEVTTGDFPISGPLLRISNYGVAEIEFTIQGVPRTVEVGDLATELGRFQLRNTGGTGDRHVIITKITLKNIGSLDAENLGSIALYIGSTRISEFIEQGTSDFYTFYLLEEGIALGPNGLIAQIGPGYRIDDGDSRNITLKGDVLGADGQGNNIIMQLDEGDTDVVAYEESTGFGAKVVNAAGNDANNIALNVIQVDAGDLNLARATDSPDSNNVAPGTDDAVLMKSRITTSTALRVKDMQVRLDITLGGDLVVGGPAHGTRFSDVYDNLRVVQITDDGASVASLMGLMTIEDEGETVAQENLPDTTMAALCTGTCNTTPTNEFTLIQQVDQTINMPASVINTTAAAGYIVGSDLFAAKATFMPIYWLIGVDFEDEPAGTVYTGTQIRARILNGDFLDVEYESTGDTVPAANIKGNSEGSIFTIRSSALECTRTDGLADGERIVAGNNTVVFAEYACNNNDSGTITISDVQLNFTEAATDVLKQDMSGVHIEVEESSLASTSNMLGAWVQVGSTEDPEAGVALTIDGLDLDVDSSSQLKLRVVGEVSTSARAGIAANRINIRNQLEGLTVYDQDGDLLPNANITSGGVAITAGAPLLGAQFEVIASGVLAQNISGDSPDTAILVANWTDFEVARFKLSAIDDNVLVDRLLFVNNSNSYALVNGGLANGKTNQVPATDPITNGRVAKFKLYGPTKDTVASTLIAATEVKLDEAFNTNAEVEFDLPNDKRVFVDDGGNAEIRVTVDVNPLNDANQTGVFLQLAWSAIDAISESSGDNLVQFQVDNDNVNNGLDGVPLGVAGDALVCWDLDGDGVFAPTEQNIAVIGANDNDGILIIANTVQRLPAAGAAIAEHNGGACNNAATNVTGVGQAEEYTIRNTKPTLTNESLGTSTLTTAAGLPIYRAKVSADDNDDVHLKRWTLEMSLDGVCVTGGFEVVDVDDPSTAIPLLVDPPRVDTDDDIFLGGTDAFNGDADAVAGFDCWIGNFKVQYDFATAEQVTKGTSKTYEFRADVVNSWTGGNPTPADGDTISVRTASEQKEGNGNYGAAINEDVDLVTANLQVTLDLDPASPGTGLLGAAHGNVFVWSDESALGHTELTDDWTNGFNLKFPTTYTSLSR